MTELIERLAKELLAHRVSCQQCQRYKRKRCKGFHRIKEAYVALMKYRDHFRDEHWCQGKIKPAVKP